MLESEALYMLIDDFTELLKDPQILRSRQLINPRITTRSVPNTRDTTQCSGINYPPKQPTQGGMQILMLKPFNPEGPHIGDIIFSRMGIVQDHYICIIKVGVGIEETAVSCDCDPIGALVISLRIWRILRYRPGHRNYADSISVGLLLDLIDQLSGWTQIDHPLLVFPSQPLADQQSDESFPASRWKLHCDVRPIQGL